MNQSIYGKDNNDGSVIFVLSPMMFDAYQSTNELKEADIELEQKFEDVTKDYMWLNIDSEDMYNGKKITIGIQDNEYDVHINKNIWPLKFRKGEADNFSYVLISGKIYRIIFRKKFDLPLEGYSFDLRRSYQVI